MKARGFAAVLNSDAFAGLIFLVIGAGALLIASGYRLGEARSMGPGYVPMALGALIAAFGLAILVRGLAAPGSEEADDGPFAGRPVSLIFASLIAFGLLIERAGLVIALPAAVVLASLAGGHRLWLEIALLGAGLFVFCWALFVGALGIPIPVWPR